MIQRLFNIGGALTSRDRWVLGFIGIVFLLLLWAVMAEVLSQPKLSVTENSQVRVEDQTYIENDSLLRDHYDLLLAKGNEELARLGLKKNICLSDATSSFESINFFQGTAF